MAIRNRKHEVYWLFHLWTSGSTPIKGRRHDNSTHFPASILFNIIESVNFASVAPVTASTIILTLVSIPLSHIQPFFKSFTYLETVLWTLPIPLTLLLLQISYFASIVKPLLHLPWPMALLLELAALLLGFPRIIAKTPYSLLFLMLLPLAKTP